MRMSVPTAGQRITAVDRRILRMTPEAQKCLARNEDGEIALRDRALTLHWCIALEEVDRARHPAGHGEYFTRVLSRAAAHQMVGKMHAIDIMENEWLFHEACLQYLRSQLVWHAIVIGDDMAVTPS